jgi:outer membrane lipoprotein-sorting protein
MKVRRRTIPRDFVFIVTEFFIFSCYALIMFHRNLLLASGCVLVLLGLTACSKKEIEQAIVDAKAKTQEIAQTATQTVEEVLPATGEIILEMESPLTPTKTATIEVISFPDGRPSVVQIISYEVGQSMTNYPKVLIQGTTDVANVASLGGTKVMCDLYVTMDASGKMAMTTADSQVQLTFKTLDTNQNTIEAQLSASKLNTPEGTLTNLRGGRLIAVAK